MPLSLYSNFFKLGNKGNETYKDISFVLNCRFAYGGVLHYLNITPSRIWIYEFLVNGLHSEIVIRKY